LIPSGIRPAAPLAVIGATLAGSRAAAYALGLRFDASEAAAFWHFVEPELLRTRLIESVFYLHAQPPLFNLWLGVYHKVFGVAMPVAFGVTYAALGVVLAWHMFGLARRLGVGSWPAAVGVAVFCASPAVLLHEHFLLYTYPVAVLLTWSAVRLHRALETGRERDWYLVALPLATLVLLRALFHPVWLAAVLAGLALVTRRAPGGLRPLVRPALVALLAVGAVLAKNQIVFGRPTLSSFAGMNLSRTVLDRTEWDTLTALVDEGALSPWALTGGFQPLGDYWPPPPAAPTGIPLLDRPTKADGSVNLHHAAYLDVSDQLARDSLTVIARHPGVYLASVAQNLGQTLHPASTYAPLLDARARLAPLVRFYEPALGWVPALGPMGVWPVLLPLVLVLHAAWLWRRRSARDPAWVTTVFMAGTVLYVWIIGSLMERTENQRFRFEVDPLIWVLVVSAAARLVAGRRLDTGRHTAPGTADGSPAETVTLPESRAR
jgi:hypothetical protein